MRTSKPGFICAVCMSQNQYACCKNLWLKKTACVVISVDTGKCVTNPQSKQNICKNLQEEFHKSQQQPKRIMSRQEAAKQHNSVLFDIWCSMNLKHIKTTQSLIIDLSALQFPITFSYIVLILYSPNQSIFNYKINCYSEISGLNCVQYKQCQERPKHLQCSLLIGQCKLVVVVSPISGPFCFQTPSRAGFKLDLCGRRFQTSGSEPAEPLVSVHH